MKTAAPPGKVRQFSKEEFFIKTLLDSLFIDELVYNEPLAALTCKEKNFDDEMDTTREPNN